MILSDICTLGKWHHLVTYKCRFCAFDCRDEEGIYAHFDERHRARAQPRPASGILIADRNGNEVPQGENEDEK